MENTLEAIGTNNLLLIFSAIAITGIVLGKLSEILKIPDVILYLLAGIIIGPSLLNLISIHSFPIENNLVLTEGKTKEDYGIGNPLKEGDDAPIIALNRYHIPNKKFWNNTPPSGIANPYKASAAVRFSIRVHYEAHRLSYLEYSGT